MIGSFVRLPVMLVILLVVLMFVLDKTGLGIRFSFSYQVYYSLTVFLFGLVTIAIGAYSFRKANTTISPVTPEKATYLVTSGIYRYSRNPMYLGFLLWLMACTVYIGNVINLLLLPVFIVSMNTVYIRAEESALEGIFGEAYVQYKNRARRWI